MFVIMIVLKPAGVMVDDGEIVCLSRVSTSRQNYAANLNREILLEEERAASNAARVLGKMKLEV